MRLRSRARRRPVAAALLAGLLAGPLFPSPTAAAPAVSAAAPVTGAAAAPARGATPSRPARASTRLAVGRRHRHALVGRPVVVTGRVSPRRAGRAVRLQVRRGGAWRSVAAGRTASGGRFALAERPPASGTVALRVLVLGTRRARPVARAAGTLSGYRVSSASWYGPGLYGQRTACGQTLTPGTFGVANKHLPCGTRVTFRHRGRSIVARVVDRGPFIPGRSWDLTAAAARRLGFSGHGPIWVTR